MSNTGRGIAIAGNILADAIKMIECFPKPSMLVTILSTGRAVGGAVANTIIDLAVIDPSLPLKAVGKCGDDEYGHFVIDTIGSYGVDTSRIEKIPGGNTGFTDVMTDIHTGERTFFTLKGENSNFVPADVDIDALDCDMFHIGYVLLLDGMDAKDDEYGTAMARLLHDVQQKGIKTSFDVVSNVGGLFREKVSAALKYTDYAIMNEIECCGVSGLNPRRDDGTLDTGNIRKSMELMLSLGVRDRVIIHASECGFMLTKDGKWFESPSMKIPADMLVGTCGAGDAYCAGCLYALYNDFDDSEILPFAASAALCNLLAADSISGMKGKEEIMKIRADGGFIR